VFAECFSDHFGDGDALVHGAPDEEGFELGIEAY
jgi:hypothetical protein